MAILSRITDRLLSYYQVPLDVIRQRMGEDEVLVIDAGKQKVAAVWKLSRAQHNVPAAYDRTTGTLLLGCRTPSKLLALDGQRIPGSRFVHRSRRSLH